MCVISPEHRDHVKSSSSECVRMKVKFYLHDVLLTHPLSHTSPFSTPPLHPSYPAPSPSVMPLGLPPPLPHSHPVPYLPFPPLLTSTYPPPFSSHPLPPLPLPSHPAPYLSFLPPPFSPHTLPRSLPLPHFSPAPYLPFSASNTLKHRCVTTTKQSQVTIFLEEPTTCSYTLTVEAGFLCPLLERTNEFGLILLPDALPLPPEPPVTAPPTADRTSQESTDNSRRSLESRSQSSTTHSPNQENEEDSRNSESPKSTQKLESRQHSASQGILPDQSTQKAPGSIQRRQSDVILKQFETKKQPVVTYRDKQQNGADKQADVPADMADRHSHDTAKLREHATQTVDKQKIDSDNEKSKSTSKAKRDTTTNA